jgi:hypothetical protein
MRFYFLIAVLVPGMVGCAYRLPAHVAVMPQQLRLVAATPQAYALHIEGTRPRDYKIPPDGRITFQSPSGLPRACSVYLFDFIRIHRGLYPDEIKAVDVIAGNATVRKLSMRELFALPSDADGYHLLKMRH